MKVLSILYRNLWDGCLSLTSWFTPKKKGLYVFTAQDGKRYNGNPKYLYHHFKRSKEVVWMTNDPELKESLIEQGVNAIYTFSKEGFLSTLRAEFIIIDNGVLGPFADRWLQPLGRWRIIQTWHGTGVKGVTKVHGMDAVTRFMANISYSVVFASSEHHRKAFKEIFTTDHVVITGAPRNDILFEKHPEQIGFEGYDKIFLYAPTFRDDHQFKPFTESFLNELDDWLSDNNYALLVRPHPQCQAFKIMDYQNIIDVSGVKDVQEILSCIDVLITDYSSIATDFALLDRPIIFYYPDHERFTRIRPILFDIEETLPGPFAYDEASFLELITDLSWSEMDGYKARYVEFKDYWHTYQDGRSCERVEALLRGGK